MRVLLAFIVALVALSVQGQGTGYYGNFNGNGGPNAANARQTGLTNLQSTNLVGSVPNKLIPYHAGTNTTLVTNADGTVSINSTGGGTSTNATLLNAIVGAATLSVTNTGNQGGGLTLVQSVNTLLISNAPGTNFSGNGSGLTNLTAANVVGTLTNSTSGSAGSVVGTITNNGTGDISGAAAYATNASQATNFTVSGQVVSGSLTVSNNAVIIGNANVQGTITTGSFDAGTINASTYTGTNPLYVGNGASLTNLNLTVGEFTNLLAATNSWTGTNTFGNTVIATAGGTNNQIDGTFFGNGAGLSNINFNQNGLLVSNNTWTGVNGYGSSTNSTAYNLTVFSIQQNPPNGDIYYQVNQNIGALLSNCYSITVNGVINLTCANGVTFPNSSISNIFVGGGDTFFNTSLGACTGNSTQNNSGYITINSPAPSTIISNANITTTTISATNFTGGLFTGNGAGLTNVSYSPQPFIFHVETNGNDATAVVGSTNFPWQHYDVALVAAANYAASDVKIGVGTFYDSLSETVNIPSNCCVEGVSPQLTFVPETISYGGAADGWNINGNNIEIKNLNIGTNLGIGIGWVAPMQIGFGTNTWVHHCIISGASDIFYCSGQACYWVNFLVENNQLHNDWDEFDFYNLTGGSISGVIRNNTFWITGGSNSTHNVYGMQFWFGDITVYDNIFNITNGAAAGTSAIGIQTNTIPIYHIGRNIYNLTNLTVTTNTAPIIYLGTNSQNHGIYTNDNATIYILDTLPPNSILNQGGTNFYPSGQFNHVIGNTVGFAGTLSGPSGSGVEYTPGQDQSDAAIWVECPSAYSSWAHVGNFFVVCTNTYSVPFLKTPYCSPLFDINGNFAIDFGNSADATIQSATGLMYIYSLSATNFGVYGFADNVGQIPETTTPWLFGGTIHGNN